ncbi:type II toxin-antitoxin system VapC family toxin [Nodosilinea sp. FACHB-141]|nr:type II toxin-antitoxin system VapC family toxin [Nodosilinea sp. FACHB-141]
MTRKPFVYIETSVVSYLASKGSRDLVIAAHQEITSEWWTLQRAHYRLFVSELVYQEANIGDDEARNRRISLIAQIESLTIDARAADLAKQLVERRIVPQKAAEDAVHIALAAVNGIDFLLTWNCKHIANALMERAIRKVCGDAGYLMPSICTPLELMDWWDYVEGTS